MSRSAIWTAVVAASVLFFSGCSASSDSSDSGTEISSTEQDTEAADGQTESEQPESAGTEAAGTDEDLAALGTAEFLPVIEVSHDGPAQRPMLSWVEVTGATRYSVVVLGSDGSPYWAWSGTTTEVPMGGIDDPDVVGPWVHEPMTWTVAATDADGVSIAMSPAADLAP